MTAKVKTRKREVANSYKTMVEKVLTMKRKSRTFRGSATSSALSQAKQFQAVVKKMGYTCKIADCTKIPVKVKITGQKKA